MTSIGTAHGKVILLGEHGVVYGTPALVAGLENGARAVTELARAPEIYWGTTRLAEDDLLYAALGAVTRVLDAPPVRLRLELDIPSGSGLGASAALGVATVRALRPLCPRSQADVGIAVQAWESVFHGSPSGVDAAAAELGGVLRFVRGQAPEPIELSAGLDLCVCLAGPPASTKLMVEQVRALRERDAAGFQTTLAAITELVGKGIGALANGDHHALGELLNENHSLLAGWNLSTPGLEKARFLAIAAGALGAKLTGSGGGGALLAIGPAEPILSAWKSHGFDCFRSRIGGSATYDA